jgi:hypothetical protein
MSLQTSVHPVRRARPAHHVYRVPRAQHTRHVTLAQQVRRTAQRLGLITMKPRTATRRQPYRRARTSPNRVELRAKVQSAIRLVFIPGPVYFMAAMLAGMAAAFLAGLWLY